MSLQDFASANPFIVILFIIAMLVAPGGVIFLYMQRRKDAVGVSKLRVEFEKLKEQGEQEAVKQWSSFTVELLVANKAFTHELAETRKEREANRVLLDGLLEAQTRQALAMDGIGSVLPRLEQALTAEFDALDASQVRMFDAIRLAQDQHSAESEQTRMGIGDIGVGITVLGAEISKRFDKIDPELLKLNDQANRLTAIVQDLPKAIAAAKTDILIELKAVNAKQITVGEQLHNASMKLDHLDHIATSIQRAAEVMTADIKQIIKAGTGPLPPLEEPPPSDEDTKKLEVTKADIEQPISFADAVGIQNQTTLRLKQEIDEGLKAEARRVAASDAKTEPVPDRGSDAKPTATPIDLKKSEGL